MDNKKEISEAVSKDIENDLQIVKVALSKEMISKLKGVGTFFDEEIESKFSKKDPYLIGKGMEKAYKVFKDSGFQLL